MNALSDRLRTAVAAPLLAAACLVAAAACAARPARTDAPRGAPAFVLPLLGTEPAGGDDTDLRVLAEWLHDAKVVGLGEHVHGSHELHRLAHRMFAYLVEHDGFTVFALEIDQAHAVMLDDYVRGARDDLDAILAERWWASAIFFDEGLSELLQWMRRHNETASKPVRFAGYDLKQPRLAMRTLLAELRELDASAAAEAEQRYEEISRLGGFGVVPSFLGYSANLTLPLRPGDGSARPLTVALRVRTSGLSRGTAGFTVRAGKEASRTARLRGEEVAARAAAGGTAGGDPWTPLEASVDVPASASEATLTIFHWGNGTVWFDGLAATLAGQPLPVATEVVDPVPLPLQMPLLQVMDYVAAPDPEVSLDSGISLRVACDPRLDVALTAARHIASIVDEVTRRAELAPASATWLRQLARLVVQATEWRTLEQPNRDVFLAENLTWLAHQAHPGARVLAVAHTSHTERLPRRMGAYMAEIHGGSYRVVSMLPLEGENRDFGDLATLSPGAPLQTFRFAAEDAGPLAWYVASLSSDDLLFALREAAAAEGGYPPGVDPESAPDVAILVRRVGAVRPLPTAGGVRDHAGAPPN